MVLAAVSINTESKNHVLKADIHKLEQKSATRKIFLYKEMDTNQYQTTIQDLLRDAGVKQLPMDTATTTLENIITGTAEIATPQTTVRIKCKLS